MRFSFLRFMVTLFTAILVLPSSASAIIVQSDLVSGSSDGFLTVDTGTGTGPTGLEWLDLTQTTGQSYNSVAGGFGGFTTVLGFSFATQAQVNQLFTNAGTTGSIDVNLGIPVQTLIGLIGCTQNCTTTEGTSRGIIDLDIFSTTSKGLGQIDFVTQGGVLVGIGGISGGVIDDNFFDSSVGSFLVRQAPPVSAVPVPAALPLFGTGLAVMGFIGWRRKRKVAATA